MGKEEEVYTMEYFSVIKKNEILKEENKWKFDNFRSSICLKLAFLNVQCEWEMYTH